MNVQANANAPGKHVAIAIQLSYALLWHQDFTNYFRSEEGVTPSEYRKQFKVAS